MREFLQHMTQNRAELAPPRQRVQMRDLKKYTSNPELEEEITDALGADGNIPDLPA